VNVVCPDAAALRAVLLDSRATVDIDPDGRLSVTGLTAAQVGDLARDHSLAIHELVPERASLEEAFMALTHDAVEYQPTADARSAGEKALA
jgi:ABC-2 type transport system ATP-binding protein